MFFIFLFLILFASRIGLTRGSTESAWDFRLLCFSAVSSEHLVHSWPFGKDGEAPMVGMIMFHNNYNYALKPQTYNHTFYLIVRLKFSSPGTKPKRISLSGGFSISKTYSPTFFIT